MLKTNKRYEFRLQKIKRQNMKKNFRKNEQYNQRTFPEAFQTYFTIKVVVRIPCFLTVLEYDYFKFNYD